MGCKDPVLERRLRPVGAPYRKFSRRKRFGGSSWTYLGDLRIRKMAENMPTRKQWRLALKDARKAYLVERRRRDGTTR
jgi:hypothetical protein